MKNIEMAALMIAGLLSGWTSAEAGVRGGTFAGTIQVALDGQVVNTGTIQLTFQPNGDYALVQNFGTTESFAGTFVEFDLAILSFWHGTVADGSPDGKGEQYGISLLGFATTFLGVQPDIDPGLIASGILLKTSQPMKLPPASTKGIVGQ